MVTNKYFILLLSLSFIIFSSSCGKDKVFCANTKYGFNLNAEIDKDLDSITTSDTIYLKIKASTTLIDSQTGKEINYSNAKNLGMVLTLLKVTDVNSTVGAIKDFELLSLKGSLVTPVLNDSYREFLFAEEEQHYVFTLGLKPKVKGNYAINLSDASNVFRSNDKCTKAFFEITFANTDQHFNFLKTWSPNAILDEVGKVRVYYFKVY